IGGYLFQCVDFAVHTEDPADGRLRADAPPLVPQTPPLPGTLTYNGLECSRRMLAILDSGGISRGDFCRVMFSNTLRTKAQINDYRAAVA
ncbi:hypothetical protein, partial [Nocardioides daeguensis]